MMEVEDSILQLSSHDEILGEAFGKVDLYIFSLWLSAIEYESPEVDDAKSLMKYVQAKLKAIAQIHSVNAD